MNCSRPDLSCNHLASDDSCKTDANCGFKVKGKKDYRSATVTVRAHGKKFVFTIAEARHVYKQLAEMFDVDERR